MSLAYVALGANLGDPVSSLKAAVEALKTLPRTRFIKASGFFRTAPVGLRNQPDFINAVAALETELSPAELLAELFAVEARFGRQRSVKNAPRTLDLDLLLHGEARSDDPDLTLPHPRMHQRAFVLAPLAEVAPEVSVPGHGRVVDLLAACRDQTIERLP